MNDYKDIMQDIHTKLNSTGFLLVQNFQYKGDVEKLKTACDLIQDGLNFLQDYINSIEE